MTFSLQVVGKQTLGFEGDVETREEENGI